MNGTVVVIPAYNPDGRLVGLVKELSERAVGPVVVVDDGSDAACAGVFDEVRALGGCEVLAHERNLGKGAALKTALRRVVDAHPGAGAVTADADGQHCAEDVEKVARALEADPGGFVLGVRDFRGKGVPFKSRWGNRVTSAVFTALCGGVRCQDTQTGLRGIPPGFLAEALRTEGERFEYEMNALMAAARAMPLVQVPIRTVYVDGNRATHFHAVRDSAMIYLRMLKYGISSLICSGIDLSAYAALSKFAFPLAEGDDRLYCTVIARCCAGVANYAINKGAVFGRRGDRLKTASRYLIVFVTQMALSCFLLNALMEALGIPKGATVPVKMCVDTSLFIACYFAQKNFVFAK
jgi:glycosyltransferase involved in cell wall biosynthesis